MLPQQEPLQKNSLLSIGGMLMLLFYTFQNFIPGIEKIPFIFGLGITVLIVIVSLLLFLPELKRDVPMLQPIFLSEVPAVFCALLRRGVGSDHHYPSTCC